jgi:hypothetical protein
MAVALAEQAWGGDRWSLTDAELCDRYVDEQREITRLEAHAALTLAEIDRRRAYEPEYLTATAFIRDRVGVSGSEARRRIGEARILVEHPGIRHAYESAVIDRPRVAMLLHAVQVSEDTFARDESVLVDTVSGLSMGDARRALDYWRQAADQAAFARDAHHTHQSRGLSISETLGGMVRIDADLDPESGAIVTIALRSLVEPTLLDPSDTRTLRQRRVDALTELCSDHLTHGDTAVSGGFRPQVTLTVTPHALHGQPSRPCELDGTVITPQAAQRIACDATVTPITTNGGTMDVGRTTRTIPPALRRALNARDQGCTYPGCERPHRWCDAHHIIHWAAGGPTSLANLTLLCRRHHRMAHEQADRLPQRE